MTWFEIGRLLQAQLPGLHGNQILFLSLSWEKAPGVFAHHEDTASELLDAAAREFARTKQWPELSPDLKIFLFYRLRYACDLASALSEADSESMFPTAGTTDEQKLTWLLVEAWGWPGAPQTQHWLETIREAVRTVQSDQTSEDGPALN